MKTISHSTLGLIAAVLYALGFAKAANHIDIFVSGAPKPETSADMTTVIPCVVPCDEAVSERA